MKPREDYDVITIELVRNSLEVVCREMLTIVTETAVSQGIREVGDVSNSIFSRDGRLIAQSVSLPSQLGGSSIALKELLKIYDLEAMKPGDCFICNDPYHGGSHPPDLILTMPYFYDGKLIGFGCCYAHHADIGGSVPGSIPPLSTEIYQEGIVIPPMKILDEGKTNETLIRILETNTRLFDHITGDLNAQLAALRKGASGMTDVINRFGEETFYAICDEILDRSERAFLEAIKAFPQGEYEFTDYLDDDGWNIGKKLGIKVKITVSGDQLTVDFTGTDPQCRGSLNCPLNSTLSAVYAVLKVLVDPEDAIHMNDGVYKDINIIVPPGTLLNPVKPGSVSSRPETQARICNVIMGALAKAVPDRVMAQDSGQIAISIWSGYNPATKKNFIRNESLVGGWGGLKDFDGQDYLDCICSNIGNTPVEATEMELAVRVEDYGLLNDSCGAGEHRGGTGAYKKLRALAPITLAVRAERHTIAPQGLFGGCSGTMGAWLHTRGGETTQLPCKAQNISLEAGDLITVISPGGGGYGDPAKRDIELIAWDLLNQKNSVEYIRKNYPNVDLEEAAAIIREKYDGDYTLS